MFECALDGKQQLGMSAAAILGDGWSRALHPEDRERVLAAWRRACDSTERRAAYFLRGRFQSG